MNDTLMEMIAGQLKGAAASKMAEQLGVSDQRQVNDAVSGALPLLFGALARNASSGSGANALTAALDRDHDGSVLDDLAGYLGGGGNQSAGSAILGHVLGSRQNNAASAISKMSGLNSKQTASLLAMLAPLVLGALGKKKREANLGASDLAGMLQREQARADEVEPDAMRVFGRLLDQDGDGDIKDDLAKLGTGMLGRLLSR